MDIDYHHINEDISTVDYEEKYDVDPNKDDTIANRNRNNNIEELDITIEKTQPEIIENNTNNNEHHEHPDNQDEEKHIHWELPPDHDESSEHIYSYTDTLDKQTVLMTMNTDYSSSEDEIKYAKMLCVQIDIGVENAGYALVDQGASRALIRRSKLLTLKTKYEEIPVISHCVLSSSGAEIPITSRFKSRIFTQGQYFGEVMFYVVEDTANADICCDIVLGRVALAKSQFPHIDTISGAIYNPITCQSITCAPAVTYREMRNGINKLIIGPEGTNNNTNNKHQNYYIRDIKNKIIN